MIAPLGADIAELHILRIADPVVIYHPHLVSDKIGDIFVPLATIDNENPVVFFHIVFIGFPDIDRKVGNDPL